ncbi:hypothetical protein ACIPPS_12220 [Streptomyces sp. NPDC090127]|uniref:hypothetical protein n=1 Tax=Streptomyces sp. NPDC090127 TaxID=3365953 RepID=UPI00381699AE
MTFTEGRRVTLAEDLRLTGHVARADGSSQGADAEPAAGFLALGAGMGGTVERVNVYGREKGQEAREYERLTSLFEDFGPQMPPASRQQLEERIAALQPAWQSYQEQQQRVTVRVRFDNGFLLDEAPADVFTAA